MVKKKTNISFKTDISSQDSSANFVEINTTVNNCNLRNKFLKSEFPIDIRNKFESYET